jgi:outer membrane protein
MICKNFNLHLAHHFNLLRTKALNKINVLQLLVSLFLLSGVFTTASAEELKIGAVSAVRLLEQSPQADAARKLIEQEFAPRDKQLVAEQKKLKAMEDKLQKDGAIMSESERKRIERDYINKKRDLKRSQDEFREDFNFRRNEEFTKIQKNIVESIQQVAKDNNYDIVLSSEGTIIYASPKADMSSLVIEYLQKQNTGGAE